MIRLDDLGQVAEDLRKRGVVAEYSFLYGPHGCVEGLDVGDDFFPQWELSLAENAELLERADFEGIKQRRAPDWSVEPPARRKAAGSSR
ncbi:MAG TPA: hypothetical protein VFA33_01195 [Bryobacteraceae bacterium]|nr:hypothetical protein [Bryobacteraceae bacterium]